MTTSNYIALRDTLLQIRLKPTSQAPIPEATDSTQQQPVFGVHDVSTEKQQEEKERARAHFLEQLRMVSEKQGRVREKARRDQEEEAEMLKRTRQRYKGHTDVNWACIQHCHSATIKF